MGSRPPPPANEALAGPCVTLSRLAKPPCWRQPAARVSVRVCLCVHACVSLPVCVSVCVCLRTADDGFHPRKSRPIHLRPPLARKIADQLLPFPHRPPTPFPPLSRRLACFFSDQSVVGCIVSPDLSPLTWCKSPSNYTRTHIAAKFGGELSPARPRTDSSHTVYVGDGA